MKKLFIALFLTLALFSSCFAQTTTEVTTVTWQEVEAAAADIEGSWYNLEYYSIDFWVPDIFENVELAEDDPENLISKFITADKSAAIGVQYVEGNDGSSIEEVAAVLAETGAENIEIANINGLDAATYTIPGADQLNVVIIPDAEDYLQFIFMPASDEGFTSVAALVSASIMPSEE